MIWPWILIGGLVLLCGGCFGIVGIAANSSDSTTEKTTKAPAAAIANKPAAPQPPPGPNVAPAGSEVRDGKFAFVVTGIDPPVKTLGDNVFLSDTAQGEYLVIHVDISNVGDRPRSYFGDNQVLIDDQGREYTNDSSAEFNINDGAVLGTDINPGNKITVAIAFDVSPGTVPTAIEFHDSMFSGGVRVAVR
ncbi:DUF4352 domain-containing protein [Nocardia vermiculata]|uniref:DUF4352 domain-containing protein n=1 Tax=Nocardia vermiculata TaxID=257274 RepID=UPI001FE05A14|nr:DUF4352 domain-containing protein [Nocardia vermiculata]